MRNWEYKKPTSRVEILIDDMKIWVELIADEVHISTT